MTFRTLILRYAGFAVIATLANLAAQRLVLWALPGAAALIPAILVGTGVGLVIKYLLDKRWIFADAATGLRAHTSRFSRYTATGIVTTAVFWGMETLFWALWQTDLMRELGAVIGLSIGYVVKFLLDRRYVFAPPQRDNRATVTKR